MGRAAHGAFSRIVSLARLWRLKLRMIASFLCFLLLTGSFGIAQQQQHLSDACGFIVQGDPIQPTVAGPEDILPLVYVVKQPDSPVEIVSVDLRGMWLSVSNQQASEQDCANYRVRNRSDRAIQGFAIRLQVSGVGGGWDSTTNTSSLLAPGQTVDIKACGGDGRGGAPGKHVGLFIAVRSVDFADCYYQASLRIPRSLDVHPVW
jgi:hypothetical protein